MSEEQQDASLSSRFKNAKEVDCSCCSSETLQKRVADLERLLVLTERVADLERFMKRLERSTIGTLDFYAHYGSLRERINRLERVALSPEDQNCDQKKT